MSKTIYLLQAGGSIRNLPKNVVLKYDPNQPRDERGRFSSGGRAPEAGAGKLMSVSRVSGKHILPNGKFTKQRQALHKKIIDQHLKGVTKPEGQPKYTFMGGGPASGKSSLISSGFISELDNTVKIDPDEIKKELPEVQEMRKENDTSWAFESHEESSYIAGLVRDEATSRGLNVVFDGTGDASIGKMESKIDSVHALGYETEGVYAYKNMEQGVQDAFERGIEQGRVIPTDVIRDIYQGVSQVFPAVATKFDKVTLVDTNDRNNKKVIAEGTKGTLNIIDVEAYQKFLSQGV